MYDFIFIGLLIINEKLYDNFLICNRVRADPILDRRPSLSSKKIFSNLPTNYKFYGI